MMRARSTLLYNLSWLLASFLLAFLVWILATVQADPIVQQTLTNVPVTIAMPEGMILVDSPRTTSVRVFARGQQSAISLLTAEDITVRADLTAATAGQHTVPLTVSVARRGVYSLDTQPSQITVTLEEITTTHKPLQIYISAPPPVDYAYDPPQPDALQAAVTGATSDVNSVTTVIADIDLADRRSPLDIVAQLVPVNAQGERVPDVTVEPRTATISVNIFPRDDVRQIALRPTIDFESLERGYVLTSIAYEPQSIYVSGAAEQLARLPDTLETTPISLAGQTDDFSVDVAIELPDDIVILSGGSTITVTLGIAAQTTARQIDNVAIEIIGLPEGYTASLTPDIVSVVLSGPIGTVDALVPLDVRAILDLNNVAPGTREIIPRVVIQQGRVTLDTTLLPPTVTVVLIAPEALPTPTP